MIYYIYPLKVKIAEGVYTLIIVEGVCTLINVEGGLDPIKLVLSICKLSRGTNKKSQIHTYI